MFAEIIDLVKSRFPGVPILSAFGNNDMIINYQATGIEASDGITKEEYYS